MVLLDARPTEKYNGYRVHSFLSVPSATTTAETFADVRIKKNLIDCDKQENF
jgi:hypothetical protein